MLTLVVLRAVRHAIACTAAFRARLDAAIDSTWCGCCQRLLSVRVGGQKLHNVAMIITPCKVESGEKATVWTCKCFGDIRLSSDEDFADFQVTILCCEHQTCPSIFVLCINRSFVGKQERADVRVTILCCNNQTCHTLLVLYIDRRFVGKKERADVHVTILCCDRPSKVRWLGRRGPGRMGHWQAWTKDGETVQRIIRGIGF